MKDLENFFLDKNETAGKIIKSFRSNFQVTQTELCEITGISEKYLSAVENDKRPIGLEVASKLAVFFNFDPITDGLWETNSSKRVVPQVIRPTWLLDPKIVLRPMEYMVDDIMKNISACVEVWERMLITTITKRSSEELTDYLLENWVKVKYLHSEVDTLERLDILKELRLWVIDVIVWVNLLREWLDLPEVSKIAILDADKQWFLRSTSALIQIIWRAARNSEWTVYMYSEQMREFSVDSEWNWILKWYETSRELPKEIDWLFRLDNGKLVNNDGQIISEAMRWAIDLTYYRRWLQNEYNQKY